MTLRLIYEFFFYRFYRWSDFVNRSLNLSTYAIMQNALLMISLVWIFNISSVLYIISALTGFIFQASALLYVVCFCTLMIFVNHFYFIKSKRYINIISHFERRETKKMDKMYLIFTLIYMVLSLIILFITMVHSAR